MILFYRVYFSPNRPLRGLTIVGLPGTEGRLVVVTESEITGQDLVLFIDFKLSNCLVGYCPPQLTDRTEVSVVVCICTYAHIIHTTYVHMYVYIAQMQIHTYTYV